MPDEFINALKEALAEPLPGADAQFVMASLDRAYYRFNPAELKGYREGAVCIFLSKKDGELFIPLIQRMPYQGIHSGQISLPGGKIDETDADFYESALRELHEEIGLSCRKDNVLGTLTDIYIPPSNFLVHPVVAFNTEAIDYNLNEREVASVLEFKLKDLMNDNIVSETTIDVRGMKIKTPYFNVQGQILWGATAMILNEFKTLLSSPRFNAFSFL